MSDTRARGGDFSHHQLAARMRWALWRALGLLFGWVRLSRGNFRDGQAAAHIAGMRAAGWLIGGYHYLNLEATPRAQARLFVALLDELLPIWQLPAMLDVEDTRLSEWHVTEFLDEFARLTRREIGIYTSANSWHRIVGRGMKLWARRLRLWLAHYPHDGPNDKPQAMDAASVARRSTPPPESFVALIPDPWGLMTATGLPEGWTWLQHTGHGRLPEYDRDLDLNVFAGTEGELRARFDPAYSTPVETPVAKRTGSLIGMHQTGTGPLVPWAAQAKPALVKIVDDIGTGPAIKAVSPTTTVIARLTFAGENGGDYDKARDDDTLRALARSIIDRIMARSSVAERAAIDYWEPINEPRPHSVAGYLQLCRLSFFLMEYAEAAGLKLALLSLNAGTPEWDEIIAILKTGIMERMIQWGHIWACHEGLLNTPHVTRPDRMDGSILGVSLVNRDTGVVSPFLPAAHDLVLRYRFWMLAARMLGVPLAPMAMTECYPALHHPLSDYAPAEIVARYAWLDEALRQDAFFMGRPFAMGATPFGVGGDQRWTNEDHAHALDALREYLVSVKDRPIESEDWMAAYFVIVPDAISAGELRRRIGVVDVLALGVYVEVDMVPGVPPTPPAPWWASWPEGVINPARPLAVPNRVVTFYHDTGAPFVPALTRNVTWAMLVTERRGNLLRVLDQAGTVNDWYVKAEDVQPA